MDDSTNQDGAGNPQRLRGSYYGIKGQEKKYFRHAASWSGRKPARSARASGMRPQAHHDDYLKPLDGYPVVGHEPCSAGDQECPLAVLQLPQALARMGRRKP